MDTRIVDHPAGSARGGLAVADQIAAHAAAFTSAMNRIEGWVRRYAADIGVMSKARREGVSVWPADPFGEGAADRYHRLAASLPEVVPTDDLATIEPPSGDRSWTEAWVGPVRLVIQAPVGTCELVQVGTETVEVPDPDAPMKAIEVPVYEYRCTEIGGTA